MYQTQLHYGAQTYIPWVQKCVIKTAGCGSSHKYTTLLCKILQHFIKTKL